MKKKNHRAEKRQRVPYAPRPDGPDVAGRAKQPQKRGNYLSMTSCHEGINLALRSKKRKHSGPYRKRPKERYRRDWIPGTARAVRKRKKKGAD